MNNLIRHELADIVLREMDDPALGFCTITGVDVSVDLRHAKVFVSVLGDDEAKRKTMGALIRARHFIRGHLRDRLDLRHIPELIFRLDDTAEKAQQIEQLLRDVAEESSEADDIQQP